MVERAAREGDGVENHHAGRAQSLSERGEIFARHHHTADQQTEAGEKTNGDAQLRRNEIVVERVFDEERDAEKQRESAEPRETFDAHELFPVDFWQRGFGWRQRSQRWQRRNQFRFERDRWRSDGRRWRHRLDGQRNGNFGFGSGTKRNVFDRNFRRWFDWRGRGGRSEEHTS